jgi:hypothetical protein
MTRTPMEEDQIDNRIRQMTRTIQGNNKRPHPHDDGEGLARRGRREAREGEADAEGD